MTTREQARAYREDLDALVVLLLAELVREWTAAGLPILPGIGRARSLEEGGRRARAGAQTALVGAGVGAGVGAAATARAAGGTQVPDAGLVAASALTAAQVNAATDELLRTLPPLVADFQSAAASLGADFFDTVRTDNGVRGRYQARPVDARDDARQEILVRWATQPLRPANMPVEAELLLDDRDLAVPDASTSLLRLVGAVERQVLTPARETVEQASDRDPAGARWAREAKPGSCAFCAMLATRGLLEGAVYHSAELAGGRLSEGAEPLEGSSHYHDDCRCIAVPSWQDAPYEPPEHVQAWANAYFQARDDTGSGDTKTILAAMRGLLGSH